MTKQALTESSCEAAGRYGLTNEELGSLHNITGERVAQIYREKPKLREAYERGFANLKGRLRKRAIEVALDDSRPPNITAIIWATKNIIAWADKTETKSEKTENINIRYIGEWDRPAQIKGVQGYMELIEGEVMEEE